MANNTQFSLDTYENCLTAVKQDGYFLRSVPMRFMTEELCIEAVRDCGYVLQFVPENLRLKSVCLAAIIHTGVTLKYVPKKLKTDDLCLEAIKQYSLSVIYAPIRFRIAYLEASRYRNFWLLTTRQKLKVIGLKLGLIRPGSSLVNRIIKDVILIEYNKFSYV